MTSHDVPGHRVGDRCGDGICPLFHSSFILCAASASEWSTWTRTGSRDMISLTLRVIAPPDYAPGTSDGSGGAALIVLPARLRNPVQSPGCFRQRALGRQIAERHNANEALIAI